MQEEQFILSLLVKNESGVLTRVAGLFARRGYNIDSLSVGETEDKELSRITVTSNGDIYVREQILKQLEKLHDVIVIEELDLHNVVVRELILVKVNAPKGQRSEIMEAVSIFRAKIVDLSQESLTMEITGDKSKCDAFIEYLRPYGISELSRTGITAMSRGSKTLK